MTKPLTTKQCEGLKRGSLTDGQSLSLHALASGEKAWRYRYRLAGKEGIFTIGRFPEISLADARALRDQAEAQVRAGTAPILARRIEQQAQIAINDRTLGHLVQQWIAERIARKPGIPGAWVPTRAAQIQSMIRRFALSHAAARLPVDQIKPQTIAALLDAAPDHVRRDIRMVLKDTFDRAIAFWPDEMPAYNPADVVRKLTRPVAPSVSHPRAQDIEQARAVLAAFEASPSTPPITKLAHRFLALTSLRLQEAGRVRWEWISDLDQPDPVIRMPASAMKGGRHTHTVCLSPAAVSLLRWARRYRRHNEAVVFFGSRGRCESLCMRTVQNTVRLTAPIPFRTHSWRHTFSTLMNERNRSSREVIDLMLAHRRRGISATEAVYNDSEHLPERHQLARMWADLLLEGAADLSAICGAKLAAVKAA